MLRCTYIACCVIHEVNGPIVGFTAVVLVYGSFKHVSSIYEGLFGSGILAKSQNVANLILLHWHKSLLATQEFFLLFTARIFVPVLVRDMKIPPPQSS